MHYTLTTPIHPTPLVTISTSCHSCHNYITPAGLANPGQILNNPYHPMPPIPAECAHQFLPPYISQLIPTTMHFLPLDHPTIQSCSYFHPGPTSATFTSTQCTATVHNQPHQIDQSNNQTIHNHLDTHQLSRRTVGFNLEFDT